MATEKDLMLAMVKLVSQIMIGPLMVTMKMRTTMMLVPTTGAQQETVRMAIDDAAQDVMMI